MTLAAAGDVNPDASGRPSPIVVRVYQLRADAGFAGAEFFALFDDADKALGADLISRDEYVMTPGERRTVDITIPEDARAVGVLAAYRDVRNAQWRAVIASPKGGFSVSVERARVVVAGAPQ